MNEDENINYECFDLEAQNLNDGTDLIYNQSNLNRPNLMYEQEILPDQNDATFSPLDIVPFFTPPQIPDSTNYSPQDTLKLIQSSSEGNEIFGQYLKLYGICLYSNPFAPKEELLNTLCVPLVEQLSQSVIVENETAKSLLESQCPPKEIIKSKIDQLVSLRKDPNHSYQSITETFCGVYNKIDISIIAEVVELAERLPELKFNGNVEHSPYDWGFTAKQWELLQKFNDRDVYLLEWAFALSNIGGHYKFGKIKRFDGSEIFLTPNNINSILGETNDQLNSFLDWNVIDAFCCRYNSERIFVGSIQDIECVVTDTFNRAINRKGIYLQPFHHARHFFLVCVNFNKSPIEILLYDSLFARHTRFNEFGFGIVGNAESVAQKSLNKFVNVFGPLLNGQQCKAKIAEDGFVQKDGHNCGIFTIANIMKIAKNERMDVKNPEIVRCEIAIQLLNDISKNSNQLISNKRTANFPGLQNDMPLNKRQNKASKKTRSKNLPTFYVCTFHTKGDFEKWWEEEKEKKKIYGWTKNSETTRKDGTIKVDYRCLKTALIQQCKHKIDATTFKNGQVCVETSLPSQYVDLLLALTNGYNVFVETSKNQAINVESVSDDLVQHLEKHHKMVFQTTVQILDANQQDISTLSQMNYDRQIYEESQNYYTSQVSDATQPTGQILNTTQQNHLTQTQMNYDGSQSNYLADNFNSHEYMPLQQISIPTDSICQQSDAINQIDPSEIDILKLKNSIRDLQIKSLQAQNSMKDSVNSILIGRFALKPNSEIIQSSLMQVEIKKNSVMMLESFIVQKEIQLLNLQGFTNDDINRLRNDFTFVDRLLHNLNFMQITAKNDLMRITAKDDCIKFVEQKITEPQNDDQLFLVAPDLSTLGVLTYTTKRLRQIQSKSSVLVVNLICVGGFKFDIFVAGTANRGKEFVMTYVGFVLPNVNIYAASMDFMGNISRFGSYMPGFIFADGSSQIRQASQYVFPQAGRLFHSDNFSSSPTSEFVRLSFSNEIAGKSVLSDIPKFLFGLASTINFKDSPMASNPMVLAYDGRQQKWKANHQNNYQALENVGSVVVDSAKHHNWDYVLDMYFYFTSQLLFNKKNTRMLYGCMHDILTSNLTGLTSQQNFESWQANPYKILEELLICVPKEKN